MKQWRKLLTFLVVVALMVPMLAQITVAEGKHPLPDTFKNLIVIEKGDLAFGFDQKTGLGTLFNKHTGESWDQYYPSPTSLTPNSPIDFSDTGYWTIKGNSGSNPRADENTVLFNLEHLGREDSDGSASISQHYPGIKITRGNYKVRLTYTAENALGFGYDLQVVFWRNKLNTASNGDNYLNTVRGPSGFVTETQNGRHTVEFDIKTEDFLDHTGTASINFALSVAEGATGKITVEKLEYIGIKTEEPPVKISGVNKSGNAITFKVNSINRAAKGKTAADCVISFDNNGALKYTLSMDNKKETFTESLDYPPTFYNNNDELHWLLPKDSGLLLQATDLESETNKRLTTTDLYCASGFNMAFFAGVNETTDSGVMAVIDSPINVKVMYLQSQLGKFQGYMPVISFMGDKDVWQEDRQVRFFFLDSGSYVDAAKSYREIAKEKGYVVTYEEKAKTNKWVERTAVSHRVDLGIDYRSLITYFDKLAEAGITNVFTKVSAMRDSLKSGAYVSVDQLIDDGIIAEVMNKYPDALLYEYENTRDVYLQDGEFKVDTDFANFAKQYLLKGETGKYFYGWTDNTGLSAHIMCQSGAIPYLEYWLQRRPLEKYPTPIKMYDILATVSLAEGQCYDASHPFSRTDTYNTKLALMKRIVEKGMDAHTEGTAEYLVPYSTSFEGSLGFMNITGLSGIGEKEDSLNEAERVPLWQLVFHDCAGTYWHWEAGTLNRKDANAYCDIFSLLYGERGMFLPFYKQTQVTSSHFATMLERIKTINTVLLEIGTEEMTNHEFLTDDGMVQRTTFKSGFTVTANLSREKTYTVDGVEIAPLSHFTNTKGNVSGGEQNGSSGSNAQENVSEIPLWAYIAIGVGLGAIVVVIVVVLVKHKKKS